MRNLNRDDSWLHAHEQLGNGDLDGMSLRQGSIEPDNVFASPAAYVPPRMESEPTEGTEYWFEVPFHVISKHRDQLWGLAELKIGWRVERDPDGLRIWTDGSPRAEGIVSLLEMLFEA